MKACICKYCLIGHDVTSGPVIAAKCKCGGDYHLVEGDDISDIIRNIANEFELKGALYGR
jgi:hypothetical protein